MVTSEMKWEPPTTTLIKVLVWLRKRMTTRCPSVLTILKGHTRLGVLLSLVEYYTIDLLAMITLLSAPHLTLSKLQTEYFMGRELMELEQLDSLSCVEH